jgi:hypothetical protein
MTKLKATGTRGSWFATVDGEKLPCVHKFWWVNPSSYHDKDLMLSHPKAGPFVDAISSIKRVILTTGNPKSGKDRRVIGFQRTGYLAIWTVDDVAFVDDGLKFRFLHKVCDLK